MKNIHLIPTDKARLYIHQGKLYDHKTTMHIAEGTQIPQNIYITSNEEIKEGFNQWYLDRVLNKPYNSGGAQYAEKQDIIILTTDQELIKEGVQAIDDEFLEWFVNNPSCEEVEVNYQTIGLKNGVWQYHYQIIIPKEEVKPHSFCETPDEKCTMNYCDENGCQNRKRELVEPKQETTLKELLLQLRNTPMTFVPKEEQKQHLIDMMKGDEELGLYEEPKQDWYCPKCQSYVSSESVTFEETHQTCNTGVVIKEPKQETLEEAIKREYEARKFNSDFPFDPQSFKLGVKWEAKRRYSEEEVKKLIIDFLFEKGIGREVKNVEEWFEQFKKK